MKVSKMPILELFLLNYVSSGALNAGFLEPRLNGPCC